MPRRKLPTALHEASGAYERNPKRRNSSEPIPDEGVPECPPHLVGEERVMWHELMTRLDNMGIVTPSDFVAYEVFCTAYATWRTARDRCNQLGDAIPTPVYDKAGKKIGVELKRNPYYTVKRDMQLQLKMFSAEFGLTASSRASVVVSNKSAEKRNPFSILEWDHSA